MIPNPDMELVCYSLQPAEMHSVMHNPNGTKSFFVSAATEVTVEIEDTSGWRYEPGDAFHLSDRKAFTITSVQRDYGHWELQGTVYR